MPFPGRRKIPGVRGRLAKAAAEVGRRYEALAACLAAESPGISDGISVAIPEEAGASGLDRDLVAAFSDLAAQAVRIAREARISGGIEKGRMAEAAARIGRSARAVSAALDSLRERDFQAASRRSLEARRHAAFAEQSLQGALGAALADEGLSGLRARMAIREISGAADLAERAADIVGEMILEEIEKQ